jgi:mRNA interferase MazF
MVTPSVGAVVLVSFPFSDLSNVKLRPAVVLADAGREDWILCQITSNPYADERSIEITQDDFSEGSLMHISYARPAKLFSSNASVMERVVGKLKPLTYKNVIESVVAILRQNIPDQGMTG